MDEVHFVSADVSRRLALAPKGENVVIIHGEHFSETYSVSCMCTLVEEGGDPTYINARTNSNSGEDFLIFIVNAILDGFLKDGDTLVVDNASVHGSSDTLELLVLIFLNFNIKLMYLPPYSPEFNPCELIFAQVKRYIREYRDPTVQLILQILIGFCLITASNIFNYYNKCCKNNCT